MRALVPFALAALLLVAAPSAASADVIFDPADADELAATLAEARADQGVCYGWEVNVDDPLAGLSQSVGSDGAAGVPLNTASCPKYVLLSVFINYTSESSESEDSASYDLRSSSGGPTRADLEGLGLDWGGLTGEDPDVVIGNAVNALPLLAADKGMGKAIEAAPATGDAPADAALTDDPGSDWWRGNGGVVMWGAGLLLAGGVFALWVLRTNRSTRPNRPARAARVPDTVPDGLLPRQPEPPTTPIAVAEPGEWSAPGAPGTETAEPTPDTPAPSEKDVAPPDQKNKE